MKRLLFVCAALAAASCTTLFAESSMGDGLTGSYWKGATNFDKTESSLFWGVRPEGTVATKMFDRVDPVIDFEWGNGNPFDETEVDFPFCVEWNGYLRAPETSPYTFDFTHWDDGFYFAIYDLNNPDSPLAANEFWGLDFKWDQPDWTCEVDLEKDKFYKVVIRHYENDNGAHARFSWFVWESSVSYEVVPQTYLYTQLPLGAVAQVETSSVLVQSVDGGVAISGLNDEHVAIYAASGQLEYAGMGEGTTLHVNLQTGMHIVVVGGQAYKVLIQ